MTVMLKIATCKDCPHLDTFRYLTADSFEHTMSWFCKKTSRPKPARGDWYAVKDSSLIAYVDRPSEEPNNIPDWCPLRTENKVT